MHKGIRAINRLLIIFFSITGLLSISPTSTKAILSPQTTTSIVDSDDYQILTSGQPRAGLSIQPATDHDTFYIDANVGQTITVAMVRTSTDKALNGILQLIDPTGNTIASADKSSNQGNPLIQQAEATTTGRYEIQVRDYSGTRSGTYQLTATTTDSLVPAASHSINTLETDPCPSQMSPIALPELNAPAKGPVNADFEVTNQELPRTSYPLNCEFARARQFLATSITPQVFSIQTTSQSQTTEAFLVDQQAQYLVFEYQVGRKTADKSTLLNIEVLSGATFATTTDLSKNTIRGQYLDGWKHGKLSLMAFRGQTIKLRFSNDLSAIETPSANVRNLRLSIEIPDWQPSPIGTTAIEYEAHIGAHAVITGASSFLISAPFTIPLQTQSLSFNYQTGRRLNNISAPMSIQVLSGANFATITNIDNNQVSGRLSDGWHHATLDIQAFRGQVVKLKILNDSWPTEPQTSYIDSFKLNRALPGWDVTNTNYSSIETLNIPRSRSTNVLTNTNFELGFTPITEIISNASFDLVGNPVQTLSLGSITLNGTNATTTTAAIIIPETATTIQFDALIGDSINSSLIKPVTVAILSGNNFELRELPIDNQLKGATQTGSQTAIIDIKRYQGKTIKLQFINHITNTPTSQFSHFRLVDHVPQWTANSQARLKIVNDGLTHPSHLYLVGSQSILTSAPFSLPANAQQVRFDYRTGHIDNSTRQNRIQLSVLSGADFGIRTQIDNNRLVSTDASGWQQIAFDLQRFQGTTIKLEWTTELLNQPYVRLDNLQVGVAVAGWQISEASDVIIEPTTSNLGQSVRIHGNEASLTSQPWTVLTDTTSLSFAYKTLRVNEPWSTNLFVYVLSGNNFEISTRIDGNGLIGSSATPNNGWQQANLPLAQFQGRTIRLQFKNAMYTSARTWIDNLTLNQGQSSPNHGADEAPEGNFLSLINTNTNQSALSSSFVVPTDTQFLRFEYQTGTFDNGNEGRKFVVELLSGSNFTTATTINQSLANRSLNDGWQVAQLPISQFQGQTVKIRITMPFNTKRSVVRIDKLALLSPRATLTVPIVATGTTYLNVPLSELGGITTTATLTITSLVIYDEYMDLAGQVQYANTTYPFALTGDLYNSNLGTAGDIVAELQDTTRIFDALYFAVRQEPFGPQTNPSITQENLSFYLQRKGTREATLIDLGLNATLNPLLSPVFQLASLDDASYGSDYWFGKLIEGVTTYEAMGDPNENIWSWKRRTIKENCTILQQLDFGVVVEAPEMDILGGSGEFATQIEVLKSISDGYVTTGMPWPAHSCDTFDEPNAGVTLGSKDDSVSVKIVSSGNNLKDNKAEGDYLSYITFGGKAAIFKNNSLWFDQFMAQMIQVIDMALAFYSSPISISSLLDLIKKETPFIEDQPTLTNEMILVDWDNNPNTEIKVIQIAFQQAVLVTTGNRFTTRVTVACKKQDASRNMQLRIYWDIPMYDTVTKRELNNMLYTKNFIVNYKSGPCNK